MASFVGELRVARGASLVQSGSRRSDPWQDESPTSLRTPPNKVLELTLRSAHRLPGRSACGSRPHEARRLFLLVRPGAAESYMAGAGADFLRSKRSPRVLPVAALRYPLPRAPNSVLVLTLRSTVPGPHRSACTSRCGTAMLLVQHKTESLCGRLAGSHVSIQRREFSSSSVFPLAVKHRALDGAELRAARVWLHLPLQSAPGLPFPSAPASLEPSLPACPRGASRRRASLGVLPSRSAGAAESCIPLAGTDIGRSKAGRNILHELPPGLLFAARLTAFWY